MVNIDAIAQISEMMQSIVAPIVTVLFPIITAIGTAVWVVFQWREESKERLAQRKWEEKNRRGEQASELIRDFGNATSDASRRWIAMALVNYPDESIPVLVNSLGLIGDSAASDVNTALISTGISSIPHLSKMNRIARSTCKHERYENRDKETNITTLNKKTSAQLLLARSRYVIAEVIKQANPSELETMDLSNVDLSECEFFNAQLNGANFRKTILNDADFTRATTEDTDFTGAQGKVKMEYHHCIRARFRDVDFNHSNFRGARLEECTFLNAQLNDSVFAEAKLFSVSFKDCLKMKRLKGLKLVNKGTFSNVNISGSEFEGAHIINSKFNDCKMRTLKLGEKSRIFEVTFTDCVLNGSSLPKGKFTHSIFEKCNLSSVDFSYSVLSQCRFIDCTFDHASSFIGTQLPGTQFEGNCIGLEKAKWSPSNEMALKSTLGSGIEG